MDAPQIGSYAVAAGIATDRKTRQQCGFGDSRKCTRGDFISLRTAIAIALAESRGNPNAHNTNAATLDNSYGLWQINMFGALGPARRRRFGIRSNDELFDPTVNARAMFDLSAGGTVWRPWSTFLRGDYRAYLDQANDAARGLLHGDPGIVEQTGIEPTGIVAKNFAMIGKAASLITNPLETIAAVFLFLTNPHNWVRIGEVLAGAVVMVIGLLTLIRDTEMGRTVIAMRGGKMAAVAAEAA
jgi:hypothetical protein